MRADRLLAELMILRDGRTTARELAGRLEVTERTVLRDMEALSAAGVPVWTERGRGGGLRLMPGWTSDLSGLTVEEARALLVAGASVDTALGTGSAIGTALAKVLPTLTGQALARAEAAAARILVIEESFLGRSRAAAPTLADLQRAVVVGRKVRVDYAGGSRPGVRTLVPAGLVCAAGTWYLLATHRGARRTYRVDRIRSAAVLAEAADRSGLPEVAAWWQETRRDFKRSADPMPVVLFVPDGHDLPVPPEKVDATREVGGGTELTVRFRDRAHAMTVLWPYADRVAVRSPRTLREQMAARAAEVGRRHSSA
ncbi:MAG: WYL domain-containing protein [Nocardioides sp.]|uniref:helix-turn-helix transcriptional regulator n=1 Tax=Nocardioides sp. TaxID=35761 RepID=UPI0039E322B2